MQELAVLRLPRLERVLSCTSDSRSGLLRGKQPPDRRLPRPFYAPTAAEDRFALTLAAMQLQTLNRQRRIYNTLLLGIL